MRKLVEYFRSVFCKHEYELLDKSEVYAVSDIGRVTNEGIPVYRQWTYMCKKCGYVKIVRTNQK